MALRSFLIAGYSFGPRKVFTYHVLSKLKGNKTRFKHIWYEQLNYP